MLEVLVYLFRERGKQEIGKKIRAEKGRQGVKEIEKGAGLDWIDSFASRCVPPRAPIPPPLLRNRAPNPESTV
jgi:hypothetical protein